MIMKTRPTNYVFPPVRRRVPFSKSWILGLGLGLTTFLALAGDSGPGTSIDEEIVVAIQSISENKQPVEPLRNLLRNQSLQREKNIRELVHILNDSNSPKGAKLFAAYYLGEMHAVEAVDILAANITLELGYPVSGGLYEMEPEWNGAPAQSALWRIGSPAIPALMHNICDSTDDKVRRESLRTVCNIDVDKDIVKVRLQKALQAEKDPQKTARLQAALNALPGMKYPY